MNVADLTGIPTPGLTTAPTPTGTLLLLPGVRLTHPQRAERRRLMAQAVLDGMEHDEVARRFGVSRATVYSACKESRVPVRDRPTMLTHVSRAERRQEMARAVLAGGTLATVAAGFGVTEGTVVNACEEHGVRLGPLNRTRREERLRTMQEAVRSGTPVLEAAEQAGVPRNRAVEMAAAAMSGRPMTEVAAEFGVGLSAVFQACVRYAGYRTGARTAIAEERRLRAAQAILAGRTVEEAAVETGLTPERVRAACREHGVRAPRMARPLSSSTFRILARLLGTTETIREVSQQLGVSFDAVQTVLRRAAKEGIRFPHREALLPPDGVLWRDSDVVTEHPRLAAMRANWAAPSVRKQAKQQADRAA